MIKKPRGLCVIINYYDFEKIKTEKRKLIEIKRKEIDQLNEIELKRTKRKEIGNLEKAIENLNNRVGSNIDVTRFSTVFSKLHFDVEIIEEGDLLQKNVQDILSPIAKREILRTHEAIVIAINSHGDMNGILCSNGELTPYNSIINIFSNENCKELKRKPKIFLFNSCRSKVDCSKYYLYCNLFILFINISVESIQIKRCASDMLVCYSTLHGIFCQIALILFTHNY